MLRPHFGPALLSKLLDTSEQFPGWRAESKKGKKKKDMKAGEDVARVRHVPRGTHSMDQIRITEHSHGAQEQEYDLADQKRKMTHRGEIWKIFLLRLGMVRAVSVCCSAAQHIPLFLVTLFLDLCCGCSLIHAGAGGVSGVQRAMAKRGFGQAPQEKVTGTQCSGRIGIHRESSDHVLPSGGGVKASLEKLSAA